LLLISRLNLRAKDVGRVAALAHKDLQLKKAMDQTTLHGVNLVTGESIFQKW
jgi:hypothetical protein